MWATTDEGRTTYEGQPTRHGVPQFFIRIPTYVKQDSQPETCMSSSKRILIVEDREDNRLTAHLRRFPSGLGARGGRGRERCER